MTDKSTLTAKQREIIEFLKSYISANGYPPSIREICRAVSLKSTSSVHAYLEALENKGYIVKDSRNSRSIRIINKTPDGEMSRGADSAGSTMSSTGNASLNAVRNPDSIANGASKAAGSAAASENQSSYSDMVMVPVVGTVAAGVPILAEEHIDSYFPIPADRLPNKQTFFLRVQGDSMVNAGILDKDFILVEQQNDAKNGDMVVALIDDSATVKTFYREKGHVRLQPQNDYIEPIIVKENLTILGKVIGTVRFFS